MMRNIASTFRVNLNWLISGEGAVFTTDSAPSSKKTEQKGESKEGMIPEYSSQVDAGEFTFVPMAEARLSAGGGSMVLSEEHYNHYAFRLKWIKQVASSLKSVILMRVGGDSMFPTIQDHDVVLIDTGRQHIQGGRLYALGIDDSILIKRLDPMAGGKCRVISDNKEVYPPYEVNLNEIRIIGQVIWFARQMIC